MQTYLRLSRYLVLFLLLVSLVAAGAKRPQKARTSPAVPMPGKMWKAGDLLFVNDRYYGIHVYSLTNPAVPAKVSYIPLYNNVDLAVRGAALYANADRDLNVYDIADPANPRLVKVVSNACTPSWHYGALGADDGDGMWSCGGCAEDDPAVASASSQGGSMARFTVVDTWLYTLRDSALLAFDVTDATNPQAAGQLPTSWTIETVFPYQDNLFLGGSTGVWVYSITNRALPAFVGSFTHARAKDPVVVQAPYAYVTLRDGWFADGGPANRLEVLQLNQLTNMSLVSTTTMRNPYGLAVQGNYAYVCDGWNDLQVLSVTNAARPWPVWSAVPAGMAYDTIVDGGILLVSAGEGVRVYALTDPAAPVLLSTIGLAVP